MKRIAVISICLVILSFSTSGFSQDNKNRRYPIEIEEEVKPEMYVANNILYLKNAPIGKRVEIFTIIGNRIREIYIPSSECDFELNLPRAIYIFRMEGTETEIPTVKKFVIK